MISEKLIRYSRYTSKKILLPDDILIREGFSCGDNIVIQMEINGGVLHFNYQCEACLQCKAVIGYIHSKYNEKFLDCVIKELEQEYNYAKENFADFSKRVFDSHDLRESCVLKPIEICLKFFSQPRENIFVTQSVKDTKGDLDCDACVSTSKIHWGNIQNLENTKHDEPKESTADYSFEYRKKWMPFAKLVLSESEINSLREAEDKISESDLQKFLKLKIDQMIFFNIKKFCGKEYVKKPLWRNIFYRQYRTVIVKKHIDALKKYIADNGLNAYFVKGAYMSRFYDDKTGIRVFLDYDILACSPREAFLIAAHLFRDGFKIFYSEFSIKRIQMQDGSETYTGHFHLQKLIYGQYKIIIDINFPGFPMGRIALYYPKKIIGNEISAEDEFIITLCHLFKHKDVFMKDINDLYLLLKTDLDFDYLKRRISENDLNFFFNIAVNYIISNYNLSLDEIEKLKLHLDLSPTPLEEWPYDYKQVYQVKRTDLNNRMKFLSDNDRIYLFPLAVFNKYLSVSESQKKSLQNNFDSFVESAPDIYALVHDKNSYFICGMGIFWNYANDMSVVDRPKVEMIVNKIVSLLGMKENLIFMPYYPDNSARWFD